MTTPATAKPKAKFSSRNLSAVFKAPLRTKPLPDNATGPLQRPNGRNMLVLGRAAVAPPAPINTPSLKRESQVHDMHVSLVPAGSNWAESAEKPQNPNEVVSPAPADVVAPAPEIPEKAWTPESVAEHLHTAAVLARPQVAVESSGRWGDDAVEHDIVRNNFRRQMQKERDFPDLKEAVEEAQTHHGHGHPPAAGRSPSRGPQESEQQHHGRATGRWANFSEQEEMHHPVQDDRWARDRYGQNEDNRWSRDRYSRHDDGYGRECRPLESASTLSPVPNDSRTHFTSSDARFDMVASGDSDRVLSHSPHRMDWSALGRRDGRSSSPAPMNEPEGSRSRAPQPNRSSAHSPASASPSPAPATPTMAADVAPTRAMNWRNLSSPENGSERASGTPCRTTTAWSKDEEPSTPVAEASDSNTESSLNSSANSSPSPAQQVQLLKRPKMLFDPKTGDMVNAKDAAGPAKRQPGGRKDRENASKGRENARIPTTSRSTPADRKPEAESKVPTAKMTESVSKNREEGHPAAVKIADNSSPAIAVNTVQGTVKDAACASETSSSISSDAVHAEPATGTSSDKVPTKGNNANRDRKRAAAKQPAQREVGSRLVKSPRDSRSAVSRGKQQTQQNPAANVRESSKASSDNTTERGKLNVSSRSERRDTGGNKPTQRRTKVPGGKVKAAPAHKATVDPAEVALLKQIAEGSTGGVVVLTDEQKGIDVSPEDDGFETVKSRRAVLTEKKQLRQRLVSAEAAASPVHEEKKSVRAPLEEQSKGEEVQENFGMVAKLTVDTQPSSKPRGKITAPRRNVAKATKERKMKPSARASGSKAKVAAAATASVPESPERVAVRPTEQVAGEAPTESPLSKKRSQSAKVSIDAKLKPRREKQGDKSARKPNDRKAAPNARKQGQGKRQGTDRGVEKAQVEKAPAAAKTRAGAAAKVRPKQTRQVYVVKTPAPPAPASAMSSAA